MPRTTFIEPLEARIAPSTLTLNPANDVASPTLSIGDATILEGNLGDHLLKFTVSLSAAQSSNVTVNFATADGTAKASDGDYTSVAGQPLTILAGNTTASFTIDIHSNTLTEGTEKFFVNLSNLTGGDSGLTISDPQATGTIVNSPFLLSKNALQYTDVDGDLVKVQFSKPVLTAKNVLNAFNFQLVDGSDTNLQLQSINFALLAGVTGSNVTITATKQAGGSGDGKVNIGQFIGAVDLGKVTLNGDLGQFALGTTAKPGPAFKLLDVQSLGADGTTTGASSLASTINGSAGRLVIHDDLAQATLTVNGSLHGLKIDGSLGNSADTAGQGVITLNGKLGNATIGSIVGGTGDGSGAILGSAGSKIVSLTLTGDLQGGAGKATGQIVADQINQLTIGGNLTGSGGANSGQIIANHALNTLTINGNLQGGAGLASGNVQTPTLGSATIKGSILGAGGDYSGTLLVGKSTGTILVGDGNAQTVNQVVGGAGTQSGSINGSTSLNKVIVEGSLIGGVGNQSGQIGANTSVKSIHLEGDLQGGGTATTDSSGAIFGGHLFSVVIDGSILGGDTRGSGSIFSDGLIDSVQVGKNITGGAGEGSASITSQTALGSITIGGSVAGGAGSGSGQIASSGSIGKVSITKDLLGGSGANSGQIESSGDVQSITIGGNLTGSTGNGSGSLSIAGNLATLHLGGNLTGGTASAGSTLINSGAIEAFSLGSVTIDGNVVAGTNGGTGIANSGAIRAIYTIGSLTIGGSLEGNALNAAIISAGGQKILPLNAKSDVAIGSITIGSGASSGSMSFAEILAGYDADGSANNHRGSAVNADAQIGTVTIGGNFDNSSIVAGTAAGADGEFGTSDDSKISGAQIPDRANLVSKIASVTIGGSASGSDASFGIVAQEVAAVTFNNATSPTAVVLHAGASNDTAPVPIGSQNNVNVLEVLA